MSNLKMKNMIILKNLPSNIIEEAILVVKSKKMAKQLEKVEYKNINKNNRYNIKSKEEKKEKEENTYIIKEAESVILDYINNVESNRKVNIEESTDIMRRYKRNKNKLKLAIMIIVIQFLIIIF